MKKTTLLTAVIFTGLSAFQTNALKAQILVSQADMPVSGNKFIVVNDSNAKITLPLPSGTNVVWPYDTLGTPSWETTVDTVKCVLPGATPYAGFFPSSTAALEFSLPGLEYAYVNSTSGAFSVNGVEEMLLSNHAVIQFKPVSEKLYAFPMNYTSTWASRYIYRTQVPDTSAMYDTIRIMSFNGDTNLVDSYGNLTTPYGTKSTLRVWQVQRTLDSVFGHSRSLHTWNYLFSSFSSDTSYTWIANGLGYPMLSMKIQKGKVHLARWIKAASTGINEVADKSGSLVYPNPASTALNIKLASCENGVVKIMDITGREISSSQFSNKLAVVNTSHLVNGVYFYQVFDKTNTLVDTGKFSVAK